MVHGGAPTRSARGAGRSREGRNGPGHLTSRRGRGPSPPGQRRRENVGQVLLPAGADRTRHSPGGEGRTETRGGGRTGACVRTSHARGGTPTAMVRATMTPEGTPGAGQGTLGPWPLQASPAMVGRRTLERPWPHPRRRRGGGESARKPRAVREGARRGAKVSTGRGQAHCPGSQGGLRKRGPWENEAPTSPLDRARVGNSLPQVVRAADLSRPSMARRKST
jgi:hypothetical protein